MKFSISLYLGKLFKMNRNIWSVVFIGIAFLVFLFAFIVKDAIHSFISEKIKEQTSFQTKENVVQQIDRNYNYTKNKKDFEFTLLEFGSGTCIPCKQMEPVLESIKLWENIKVNVQFIHNMKAENQEMIKFYGISAVPIQILLDKNGVEFFKHYGFISEKDLLEKFQEKLNSSKLIM